MSEVHAAAAWLVLGGLALLGLASAVTGMRDAGHAWLARGRRVVLGLIALQSVAGTATLASGGQMGEGLHLLYGAALLGVFPLATTFAAEAPARAQAWVVAAAAVVALLITWRLFATG